jgi:CYTH domain-containing protein
MRGGDDEVRSPKYAHIERERRFLVDRASRPDLAGLPFVQIQDRYIVGTRLRLRRMDDSATGLIVLKLTKKYEAADALARPIVTAYLADAEYEVFAALPALALSKRRYAVETPDGAFGIDLFEDALQGLELAEIELADDVALRALSTPPWAIADVSEDGRYEGAWLARLGRGELAALLASPTP